MNQNGFGHDAKGDPTRLEGTAALPGEGSPSEGKPHRAPSLPFSLVLLLLVAGVAYVGFAGLDQSLRAARGEGAPGVFTMSSLSCVQHPGHESCTCNGTYTADSDGEARGVYLHAAGRETCQEDEEIPAVDVGAENRVYGPDGSREWILSSVLLAGSAAAVGGITATWVRHLRGVRAKGQWRGGSPTTTRRSPGRPHQRPGSHRPGRAGAYDGDTAHPHDHLRSRRRAGRAG